MVYRMLKKSFLGFFSNDLSEVNCRTLFCLARNPVFLKLALCRPFDGAADGERPVSQISQIAF